MSEVRVRFAPSPTGLLHIGGARTALFNWLYARHTGGKLVLRIEDTDAARNTPEAVAVIFQGLRWLGLNWDEGAQESGGNLGEYGPYYQSQRSAIYQRYAETLLAQDKAYRDPDGSIRFRMPRTPGVVHDQICGDITFDRTMEPDPTIIRKDGSPIFHFVNVIDDMEMKITHVIRGEDHLSNTHKHIALFEALGGTPPLYAHIPLILNSNGSKMSKRDQGASITEYIDQGYLAAAVRNYLCLLGWSPKDNREVLSIEEVIEKFDLPQVNRSNARFDLNKLFWINGEYFRSLTLEELEQFAEPILQKAGVLPMEFDRNYFRAALAIVKEKVKIGRELPEWLSYFFTETFPYDPAAVKKVFTPDGLTNLKTLRDDLAEAPTLDAVNLEFRFKSLAAASGQKVGVYIHPARLAVSGRPVGPSLYHLLEVLGRKRVLSRMDRALQEG